MSDGFQFNKKYKYSFVGMIINFIFSKIWGVAILIMVIWGIVLESFFPDFLWIYKNYIGYFWIFIICLHIRNVLSFNISYDDRGVWIEKKIFFSGYQHISWDFIERAYCYRSILPVNELIHSYNICVEHIIKEDKNLRVNHIKNGDRLVREINSYLRSIRRGNVGNIIVSEG